MTISPSDPTPFVLGFEFDDWFVAELRSRFPAIEFVTSLDRADPDSLRDAVAALCWSLTPEQLERSTRLQWVQWIGAGVESAPLSAIAEREIRLTNASGVHGVNMAEHIMAMMLAFTRSLPLLIRAQDDHAWVDNEARSSVGELFGSSLLIVGSGAIGSELASRAVAFGMRTTAIGRNPRKLEGSGVDVLPVDDLDTLLPAVDHVALALPETRETRHLIEESRFARMKPGSFIYNVGRGSAIDTDALVQALESNHLGGAGLDVVDPEPLPEDHPLWTMRNVVITAHSAGATPYYWHRLFDLLVENIERYQSGRPLRNRVDLTSGY